MKPSRIALAAVALVAIVAASSRAVAQASAEPEVDDEGAGFTPPEGAGEPPPLSVNGYIDVGFVDATGNGTSFPSRDTRLPADYGVDAFAPAVNSRGDVASTDPSGRFVNGFLPRSVNVGGRPSFLVNVVNLDLRYQPRQAPVLMFARLQYLPRFLGAGGGDGTQVFVEQAFGRVAPLTGRELFLFVGKFDSVFGIEYLDNPSPIRTGVTPSLMARYTTGTSIGAKLFYRVQIAPLWSALSVNASATNSGSFAEPLVPPDASLTGKPIGSGRIGYELDLPRVQLKLGGSASVGPRNDQYARKSQQRLWGADARLLAFGFALAGEYVHVDEDAGSADKQTSQGEFPLASGFHARGFWAQAAYTPPLHFGALRAVTAYGRYERRRAYFEGFRPVEVARVTSGLRVDLWSCVIVKAEVLLNQEREGAPDVSNDVFTSSAVFVW